MLLLKFEVCYIIHCSILVSDSPLIQEPYNVSQETERKRALSMVLSQTKQQERKDAEVFKHYIHSKIYICISEIVLFNNLFFDYPMSLSLGSC